MILDELQICEQKVVFACSPGLTGHTEVLTWFFISPLEMLAGSFPLSERGQPDGVSQTVCPQLAVTSVYAK